MKFLIIIFLVVSCGDMPQATYDDINRNLQRIGQYDHNHKWRIQKIREEVRAEINEYYVCKKVLAELKTAGETLREQSWNICSQGYATKRHSFTTILSQRKTECRYDKGVRDYDTHNFCSSTHNKRGHMFTAPSSGEYEIQGSSKRRKVTLKSGDVYLLGSSTFRVRKTHD